MLSNSNEIIFCEVFSYSVLAEGSSLQQVKLLSSKVEYDYNNQHRSTKFEYRNDINCTRIIVSQINYYMSAFLQ